MKFNCDSCGQRYAISDEKARGKVLKIRCRKCKQVIVVRGAPAEPAEPKAPVRPRRSREAPALNLEPEAEADRTRMMSASSLQDALAASLEAEGDAAPVEREEKTTMMSLADLDRAREASAVAAAGDGADGDEDDEDDDEEGWFAVIGGQQQGPFDDGAFDAKVAAGRITERTYVWREGMDGWRPAKSVPILAARFAPVDEPDAPDGADEDHPLDTFAESVGPLTPVEAPAAEPAAPGAEAQAAEGIPDAEAARRPSGDAALDALFEDIPEAAPGDADVEENVLDQAIHDDPFAQVPDAPGRADEPPRENTQMFILASGVNKRKSPVRIAAFVLGLTGVLAAMGYLVLYAGGDQAVVGAPHGSPPRHLRARRPHRRRRRGQAPGPAHGRRQDHWEEGPGRSQAGRRRDRGGGPEGEARGPRPQARPEGGPRRPLRRQDPRGPRNPGQGQFGEGAQGRLGQEPHRPQGHRREDSAPTSARSRAASSRRCAATPSSRAAG